MESQWLISNIARLLHPESEKRKSSEHLLTNLAIHSQYGALVESGKHLSNLEVAIVHHIHVSRNVRPQHGAEAALGVACGMSVVGGLFQLGTVVVPVRFRLNSF